MYTENPLDREAQALHNLQVSVMDQGGRASFAQVRVSVRDKNDNAPVFTLPGYQGNINTDAAPGITILKVSVVGLRDLHEHHDAYPHTVLTAIVFLMFSQILHRYNRCCGYQIAATQAVSAISDIYSITNNHWELFGIIQGYSQKNMLGKSREF